MELESVWLVFFLLIDMIFLKQNAVITLFCFLYCLWIYSYWHLDCWGGGDTEEEIDCNDDSICFWDGSGQGQSPMDQGGFPGTRPNMYFYCLTPCFHRIGTPRGPSWCTPSEKKSPCAWVKERAWRVQIVALEPQSACSRRLVRSGGTPRFLHPYTISAAQPKLAHLSFLSFFFSFFRISYRWNHSRQLPPGRGLAACRSPSPPWHQQL